MISSPGCLCLMGFASGLITTRFWISDAPGSAQVVVLQVGPVDTWDVCLCRGGRTPIGGGHVEFLPLLRSPRQIVHGRRAGGAAAGKFDDTSATIGSPKSSSPTMLGSPRPLRVAGFGPALPAHCSPVLTPIRVAMGSPPG
jgi:hypothetical protein